MAMKDHSYSLLLPKKSKHKEVTKKRNRDRRRAKSRVYIGVAFPRWKAFMSDAGLRTDAEVACFLLDR